jgi:hypothetical protein
LNQDVTALGICKAVITSNVSVNLLRILITVKDLASQDGTHPLHTAELWPCATTRIVLKRALINTNSILLNTGTKPNSKIKFFSLWRMIQDRSLSINNAIASLPLKDMHIAEIKQKTA